MNRGGRPTIETSGLTLRCGLDWPLPDQVEVGAGTALFVGGWCFAREARLTALHLLVDGQRQPLLAFRAPRRDVLDQHPDEPYSYRSGFWGIARLGPRAPGEKVEIAIAATAADGRRATARLATVAVGTPLATPLPLSEWAKLDDYVGGPEEGPLVAIAMATYEPPPELLRKQIESLRAQSYRRWVCVISDDRSSPARRRVIEQLIADDPRFHLSVSPERLRFYRNFERALRLVPREAQFVALADQDDRWQPRKLERLLAAIGNNDLVYSDQRIVDEHGRELAATYWSVRDNDHRDLAALLFANCVTGAASLFRRDLLDVALPFPPRQFAHFHDHWLALVARLRRGVDYLPQALSDYVQHGAAVLGHDRANDMPSLSARLRRLREDPRQRLHRWRLTYFVDCCRLMTLAEILEQRLGQHLSRGDRRALQLLARAERSPLPWLRLWLRAARELVGRPRTLAAELGLALALLWRRLAAFVPGASERPRPIRRIDAAPPARLIQQPGRRDLRDPAVGALAAKIAPLELAVSDSEPERLNLLIPHVDLKHLFGGYLTKFALALTLAEHGRRLRVVTVDPQPPLPGDWRRRLASYPGLEGIDERVEFAFGRESEALRVSPRDGFVATTWWTAHVAHAALRELGREGEGFLYLIQEYEPFTFPMGSHAALAAASYEFPHAALFSTELLRDWFRERRIGVFAAGDAAGESRSLAFRNPITPVAPPSQRELAARRERRLLFYARPESHAARNMYELGVLALVEAARRGAFDEGPWQLNGIGSVEGERSIEIAPGLELRVGMRCDQRYYAQVLREHDVGLALMYTPHPSLVPIEMAASGMVVVTNTFETKTADRLHAISPNLMATDARPDALAEAIAAACRRVEDTRSRVAGALAVTWPRGRKEAFSSALVVGILELERKLAVRSTRGAQDASRLPDAHSAVAVGKEVR